MELTDALSEGKSKGGNHSRGASESGETGYVLFATDAPDLTYRRRKPAEASQRRFPMQRCTMCCLLGFRVFRDFS